MFPGQDLGISSPSILRGKPVNRTKGFVNLNRFKSGRAIKQLKKVRDEKPKGVAKGKRG